MIAWRICMAQPVALTTQQARCSFNRLVEPSIDAFPQVNGVKYCLFECVYLRPWPNAAPWIARIEEILSRIAANNEVQSSLGVRRGIL